jgi:DNA-binding HxlR family transcriptional regulator
MSDAESDVAGAWRILGKRWTLPILKSIGSKEAMRFYEIKRAMVGISSTMLSERFLELEREGLVAKKIHYSRAEYSLTASARGTWSDNGGA